jgi:pimeloyl-ACP methyl ester carboxylesterase
MGSVGVDFPITEGLDRVWGYTPSIDAMRKVMDVFAYDRALIGEDLVELRYRASSLPGRAEAFSAMFPAPRQRWVKALAFDEDQLKQINHETLIIHGREDRVIPPENSLRLHHLIDRSELHIFGRCGHWTQVEHASSFSALVMQFLERP